jgi:hypothetical protein
MQSQIRLRKGNKAAENGELTLEDAQHLKLTCSDELT